MSMERTRIRSEAPVPTPDARLLKRLHDDGYQARTLHFTNIRIAHEHAQDGADAAQMVLETAPDVVLVELIGPPSDLAATMNAYIRSEVAALPEEVPGIEFLHAMLDTLRTQVAAGAHAPVLAIADYLEVDQRHIEQYFAALDATETLALSPVEHFNDQAQQLLAAHTVFSLENNMRELVIVDEVPNALGQLPAALTDAIKTKEQLHIAAPYGMLHGGLSKAFREEGASVGAYVHDDARLSPLQALGFKCDYGEGTLDDAKRALLGRRIESFIEGLLARGVFTASDGARLPALSRKETAQLTWRAIQKMTQGEPPLSLDDAYAKYFKGWSNERQLLQEHLLAALKEIREARG